MSDQKTAKHFDIHIFNRVVVRHDNIDEVRAAAQLLHSQFPMLTLEINEVPEPATGPSRFYVNKVQNQFVVDKEPVMVPDMAALKALDAENMEMAAIEGDRATRFVYRKDVPMDRIPKGQFVIGRMFESNHGGIWIERKLLQERMMAEMQAVQQAQQGGAGPGRGVPNMNGQRFR